jgi:hypothetical protein
VIGRVSGGKHKLSKIRGSGMTETNCSNGGSTGLTRRSFRIRWPWAGLAALFAASILLVLGIVTSTWQQMQSLRNNFTKASLDEFYLGVHLRESLRQMSHAVFRYQLSDDDHARE